MAVSGIDLGRYSLGWRDAENYVFKPKKGVSTEIVEEMSWMKGEPDWMRQFRLKSFKHFLRRPMPTWGGDLEIVRHETWAPVADGAAHADIHDQPMQAAGTDVWRAELVVLPRARDDELPGLQMPPEIGIGNFIREDPH